MATEANIKANLIIWAIERAGYKLHEFAAKFPKAQDWIEGAKRPT